MKIRDIRFYRLVVLEDIYRLERYEEIHKARILAYTRFYCTRYWFYADLFYADQWYANLSLRV